MILGLQSIQIVWTDYSKLLQKPNFTAREPRRAPHDVILLI